MTPAKTEKALCEFCGTEYTTTTRWRRRFCSSYCQNKAQRGRAAIVFAKRKVSRFAGELYFN